MAICPGQRKALPGWGWPKGKTMNMKANHFTIGAAVAIVSLSFAAGATAQEIEDELIAEGKLLYEETAGDVGCALCHGLTGTGDPDAGGVFIQGVLASQMYSAINGGVELMTGLFDDLNTREVAAIHAYLDYLYLQSRATGEPTATVYPGKLIFEETAGDIGCATCHEVDATGGAGPNIQNRTAADIRAALDGGVKQMSFIELTDEEVDQVAEYLHYLLESAPN
jgi:mono/diheme cytochrome c family protein